MFMEWYVFIGEFRLLYTRHDVILQKLMVNTKLDYILIH